MQLSRRHAFDVTFGDVLVNRVPTINLFSTVLLFTLWKTLWECRDPRNLSGEAPLFSHFAPKLWTRPQTIETN